MVFGAELRESGDFCAAILRSLDALSAARKRRMLLFVTGVERLPAAGSAWLSVETPTLLRVRDAADARRVLGTLPQAHTCDNVLEVPNYWSAVRAAHPGAPDAEVAARVDEVLRDRFDVAIDNADGYALDDDAAPPAAAAAAEESEAAETAETGEERGETGESSGRGEERERGESAGKREAPERAGKAEEVDEAEKDGAAPRRVGGGPRSAADVLRRGAQAEGDGIPEVEQPRLAEDLAALAPGGGPVTADEDAYVSDGEDDWLSKLRRDVDDHAAEKAEEELRQAEAEAKARADAAKAEADAAKAEAEAAKAEAEAGGAGAEEGSAPEGPAQPSKEGENGGRAAAAPGWSAPAVEESYDEDFDLEEEQLS